MTETALLVAQIAVLLLLFGFVWAVVRSSSRTIGRAAPPPMPLEDPVQARSDTAAHPLPLPAAPAATAPRPVFDDVPPPLVDPPPIAPAIHIDAPRVASDPFAGHIAAEPLDAPADLPPLFAERTATAEPDEGNGRRDPAASTAQVLAAGIEPRLVVEASPGLDVGTVYALGGGLTIGRSRSNDLHVDDSYVSHMHARILRRGSFYFVEDLGSTNGTFLNDQRIENAQLRVRDSLRMGETTLRYEE